MSSIKNHLRKIREERMMSKAELARKAGISVLTVDRIEKGFPCRHSTKRKILEALEIGLENKGVVFPEKEEDDSQSNDGYRRPAPV